MPFVKRKIEPKEIRRHEKDNGEVFEEHTDVANNALVRALLQLSSVTFHAEDIFREIEIEISSIYKRCSKVNDRIDKLQKTSEHLNPKEVQIPVSDLDTEFKIPIYLQYHSRDSVEEDLFTTDSRTPCLIHLHKLAKTELSGVFRGSQAYAKSPRPKSLDPNLLLDDNRSPRHVAPSKSITNIVASPELTDLYNPQSLLPTPKEKMEIESAQHQAQIITVDTSGVQFERRVNLRRSQRSSISAVRRKSQHKFRERHKTLTALPGSVSNELGIQNMGRPSSLHSDANSNSSFLGDSSVVSGGSSPRQKQNAEMQTDDVKVLPASPIKRRLKNRFSLPAKSVPVSPQRGAHVSLQHSNDNSTYPRNHVQLVPNKTEVNPPAQNGHVQTEATDSTRRQHPFMRELNSMGEDRSSSGFWSGTESCRHSTTSEILMQHHSVTQALQQVLAKKPAPASQKRQSKNNDNNTNASSSTLSINSRLSTLDHSTLSSPTLSLSHASIPTSSEHPSTPDTSMLMPRSELHTPLQLALSPPAGSYNFMNPGYEPNTPKFRHLASPMDLLILGNRRSNDGLLKDSAGSVNSSIHSQDQEGYYTSMHNDSGLTKRDSCFDKHSVFTPNTPQTFDVYNVNNTPLQNGGNNRRFFGSDFISNDERLRKKQLLRQQKQHFATENDFQKRLHEENESLEKPASKPSPPRRASSLKSSRHHEAKEILAYMEPLSGHDKPLTDPPTTPSSKPDESRNYGHVQRTLSFGMPGSVERKRMSSAKMQCPTSGTPVNNLQQDLTAVLQQRNRVLASSKQASEPKPQPSPKEAAEESIPHTTQYKRPLSVYEVKKRPLSPTEAPKRSLSVIERKNSALSSNSQANSNGFETNMKPLSLLDNQQSLFTMPAVVPEKVSKASALNTSPATIPSPRRITRDKPILSNHVQTSLMKDTAEPSPSCTNNNVAVVTSVSSTIEGIHGKIELKEIPQENTQSNSNFTETESKHNATSNVVSFKENEKSKQVPTKPLTIPATSADNQESTVVKPPVTPVSFRPTSPKKVYLKSPRKEQIEVRSVKPPVAAKPLRQLSAKRPAVQPKPILLPKPQLVKKADKETNKETSQVGAKSQEVKNKTANARAAFFGLSSPGDRPASPITPHSQNKEEMSDGETDIDALCSNTVETDAGVNNKDKKSVNVTNATFDEKNDEVDKLSTASLASQASTASDKPVSPNEEESKSSNEYKLCAQSMQCAEATREIEPKVIESSIDKPVESAEDKKGEEKHPDRASPSKDVVAESSCGRQEQQDGSNEITAESIMSPSSAPSKTADFLASMHKLRGSLRPSSPPQESCIKSSLNSPFNGRHNGTNLDRRRKASAREDFKALILQNLPKSGSSSQMSATEKLQMSLSSSKVNGTSQDAEVASDVLLDTARQRILSVGDLRAAMTASRQGRRVNRSPDLRKSYAGSTSYYSKKHPPISLSGRYNSRSRTPTRPMMSISEDIESEQSPEKEERPRCASMSIL